MRGWLTKKLGEIQFHVESGGANEHLTAATVACSEVLARLQAAEGMTLDEYQVLAARTLHTHDLALGALGVAGEAGEVADIVKKHLFHGHDLDEAALRKEVGDVCWYLAAICTMMGWSFNDVAQANIDKLKARYPRGFSEELSRNRVE